MDSSAAGRPQSPQEPAERRRLAEADSGAADWRAWGPYLAERAWGTVREDYSPDGDAWGSFPFDHARSRTYRWNEDGMAGICDDSQQWCFALALWNGRDPILKERAFGLSGPEGNHGEDVKDYFWYLDNTPTHSYFRWRYHYPQQEFPYELLRAENAKRTREVGEYELLDTGIFDDDRFWVVDVTYAKAATRDLVIQICVTNAGDAAATLNVLPTLWFRNTWTWGNHPGLIAPTVRALDTTVPGGRGLLADAAAGPLRLSIVDADGAPSRELFCDNESNLALIYPGATNSTAYPKDGIGDHLIHGTATVNPDRTGSKAALDFTLTVEPQQSRQITLRLTQGAQQPDSADEVLLARRTEADEFHDGLAPNSDPDTKLILRQAIAGMLWSKQYYRYDVARWLDGDPAEPPPPDQRRSGRNRHWTNLDARDVISMPDPWEYPWFATWDLGFHCIVLSCVDPEFAKSQLLLLTREWYMHPSGQLPAYEWNFGDVNPPVHAAAALEVFRRSGSTDTDFLARIFHKLSLNFTWWTNRKDIEGTNIFSGGFLGLDNIGPINRSALPAGMVLEQSDGTAWMASYCLHMLQMAIELSLTDRTYEQMAIKFFEHFALIAAALDTMGLWDDADGFYYDLLSPGDGSTVPLRVRSMVGLLPLSAVVLLPDSLLDELPEFGSHVRWFIEHRPKYVDVIGEVQPGARLLSVVSGGRLDALMSRLTDPAEFASPFGLRSLSKAHADQPFTFQVPGLAATIGYEPAESSTWLYGGNSNWRGPIWFPVNYVVIRALRQHGEFHRQPALLEAADHITAGLVSLFRDSPTGRPVFGCTPLLQRPGRWHDLIPFHEYFHGDTGQGLGAAHQTGWTGLVIPMILDAQT